MNFLCDICDYKSNYKFNLNRHIKSKHAQNVSIDAQNVVLESQNVSIDAQNVTEPHRNTDFLEVISQNVVSKSQNVVSNIDSENEPINKCLKCSKVFSSLKTLKYHFKNCNSNIINPLQCQYCNRGFTSRQNKSKHIKVCKIKEVQTLIEEHTNINNIQNIQNNQNQNIIINKYYGGGYRDRYDSDLSDDEKYATIERSDFGKEKIDYISNDDIKDLSLHLNIKELIDKIHFNEEHPENHNIRRDTNKSLKVWKNNKWRIEPKQVVYDKIEDQSKKHLLSYTINNLINNELNDSQSEDLLQKWDLYDTKNKKKGIILYIDIKVDELIRKRQKSFVLENDKKQTLIDNVVNNNLIEK